MEELLKIIAGFSNFDTRLKAANELSAFLAIKQVLCFVRDEAIQTYLPAKGFPKTILDATGWQKILQTASVQTLYEGLTPGHEQEHIVVISSKEGCALVLIGEPPGEQYIAQVQNVFPLISAIFKMEFSWIDMESRMKNLELSSTKSTQLSKHLDKAREKLQDALRTEEEFLSIASHELKTPITSINAFLGILLMTFPEEKDKQTNYFLKRTKFQVERLISLISELLDVTKIKAGKLDMHFSVVNVKEMVEEIIKDFTSTYSSHEIIKNELPEIMIRCDKNRIEQVLSNLLSNAIKYSPGGNKILFDITANDGEVKFTVQDFGIGIAEKNKLRVFDKFFRENAGDAGILTSLGLGLYICADIVKRHRGRIWVESELGKGTSFQFTIPRDN